MKKLLLTTMVVTAFLLTNHTEAQVNVHLNVNLGGRPNWGIPGNYSGDYYYLPEIDSYYDIPRRQFIYFDGGGWMYASELPYQYRDYDLYSGFKVSINEPRPYLHCQVYRERYSRYYNTYQRPVIYAHEHPDYSNNRYGNNPYGNNRYGNNQNNRYNNDQFNRGRENQHFDNRRKDDDHDRDDRGRGRDNERGRGNDNERGHGRGHGRE